MRGWSENERANAIVETQVGVSTKTYGGAVCSTGGQFVAGLAANSMQLDDDTINNIAQKMLSDQISSFATSCTLLWAPDAPAGVAIPSAIRAIRITCMISQDSDKSRLLFTYSTAAASRFNITVSSIIVPQTQPWCPDPK
jgi:hypothetical protein